MSDAITAQLIWNRACDWGAGPLAVPPGDQALENMLLFHGVAMNGGLLHAIDHFGSEELDGMLDPIKSGYRYFGLGAVADLLDDVAAQGHSRDDRQAWDYDLNRRYAGIIPDDSALFARFETVLAQRPSDFAAV